MTDSLASLQLPEQSARVNSAEGCPIIRLLISYRVRYEVYLVKCGIEWEQWWQAVAKLWWMFLNPLALELALNRNERALLCGLVRLKHQTHEQKTQIQVSSNMLKSQSQLELTQGSE